jgi:predicted GIY-YIG superfamily endonuclease
MLPIELVYYEAYKSKEDAKNREKQLKRYGNALLFLKKRTKNCLS